MPNYSSATGRKMTSVPTPDAAPEPIRALVVEFADLHKRLNQVNTDLAHYNRNASQLRHQALTADAKFAAESGRTGTSPKSMTPNMDKLMSDQAERLAANDRLRAAMLAVGDEMFAWFDEHGAEARHLVTSRVEELAEAYRDAIAEVDRVSRKYHEALDVRAWVDRVLSGTSQVSWLDGASGGPTGQLYEDARSHERTSAPRGSRSLGQMAS